MEESTTEEIPLIDKGPSNELEFENNNNEQVASIPSAIFNLTNTIIGAGILSLPFAFENTGIVLGPLILFFVWLMVVYSCILLIKCSKLCNARSYVTIAQKCFGKVGVLVTQIAVAFSCFGAFTSYLVIVGDILSPSIALWLGGRPEDYCNILADRRFSISLALLVVCPLSMLRHIDSLKYTSYVATIAVLYLVVIVVVRSGESLVQGMNEDANFANISTTIFRAVPIITLAYTCQMNLFSLVTTLRNPTRTRIRVVVISGLAICLVAYTLVGLFGYLTFYETVQGNVLLNYEVQDIYVTVGRIGVGLVVIFSFPLMCHPTLDIVDGMFFSKRPFSYKRRFVEMILIVGTAYTIAMLVDDISVILGIAGATGSTIISFILPSLFYLKLKKGCSVSKVLSIIMLVLGLVFMCISTVMTIIDAANPSNDVELAAVCNKSALSNGTFIGF